jgi:murein DD-endopeptidase MepM/ murein hydrolase activator NlpD
LEKSTPKKMVPNPSSRTKKGFLWPVSGGRILSRFGPKKDGLHNDGINIAVSEGTKVHASENGVVAYAGNELRGYGNLLIIRHAGGYMTAYAHNSQVKVARGDKVARGQVIAFSGSSGSVDSSQVHFEIRRGAQALNPEKFLKKS